MCWKTQWRRIAGGRVPKCLPVKIYGGQNGLVPPDLRRQLRSFFTRYLHWSLIRASISKRFVTEWRRIAVGRLPKGLTVKQIMGVRMVSPLPLGFRLHLVSQLACPCDIESMVICPPILHNIVPVFPINTWLNWIVPFFYTPPIGHWYPFMGGLQVLVKAMTMPESPPAAD